MDRVEMHVQSGTDERGRVFYQAELWVRPFSGWCLATTRRVSTRGWAQRDGARIFGPFIAEQNRKIRRKDLEAL